MQNYAKYLGIGLQLAVTLLVFIFLGYFIDRKFGFLPWGTLAGALMGFVIGFYNLMGFIQKKDEN